MEEVLDIQKRLNCQLANKLVQGRINSLRLTSLGNSIASGYSCVRSTKPLLFRNESIEGILSKYDIDLQRYHFARAQNNNDEHIYHWLTTNIKESEIYQMNRIDYGNSSVAMTCHGITNYDIDRFYPISKESDMGLQDVILKDDIDLANIVIYNGCTGSFLDNMTRGGRLKEKFTYGFQRDLVSLESTLKYIQTSNREKNTNTQVYLCGAPNFLGLGITNIFINNQLKNIAKSYANVTYVDAVNSKFLYRTYDQFPRVDQFSFSDIFSLRPDIHYNEVEYLKFNNHILKQIVDHYLIKKVMIRLDRDLYRLNRNIELGQEIFKDLNFAENLIFDSFSDVSGYDQKIKFLIAIKNYLIGRVPYDFYCLSKRKIKQSIEHCYKQL